jgi:hypothetical protein
MRRDPEGWWTPEVVPDVPGGRYHDMPAAMAVFGVGAIVVRLPQMPTGPDQWWREGPPWRREGVLGLWEGAHVGRPRRNGDEAKRFALLMDVDGLSAPGAVRLLEGFTHPNQAATARARRHRDDARANLCGLGVLPWAVFRGGRVARGWEDAPEVADWLHEWQLQACLFPQTRLTGRYRRPPPLIGLE